MKNRFNIWIALLAGVVALTGCGRDETGFVNPERPNPSDDEMGYIHLGGGGLSLAVYGLDEEVENPAEGTRADGNTDVESYTVEIVSAESGRIVHSFAYGERGTAPIRVPFGSYFLRVYSGDTADLAWDGEAPDQPTYGAETDPFTVTEQHTEEAPLEIGEVVCKPLSVKISLSLEEAMATGMSEGTEVDVILNEEARTTATYDDKAEGPRHYGICMLGDDYKKVISQSLAPCISYLKPSEANEDLLQVCVRGSYNGIDLSNNTIRITGRAKAGEWRKISLYIDEQTEEVGAIVVRAVVESWVYDQPVTVDVASTTVFAETAIPDIDDPDAPRIAPVAGSFLPDDMNYVTAADYSLGEYRRPTAIDLTTTSAVTRFAVRVSTDNAAFSTYLSNNNMLATSIDLMQHTNTATTNARATLKGWGFPGHDKIEDAGNELSFNLKGLMNALYNYPGVHQVVIAVTDSQGHYSRIDLDFTVDLSQGGDTPVPDDGSPVITWVGGYDIKKAYRIADVETCQVKVVAPGKIAKFIVTISGRDIVEALGDMKMPTTFDLCDPNASTLPDADDPLGDQLSGMGFPVGNEVKGQTEIGTYVDNGETKYKFDITGFLSILAGVTHGQSNFQLTVTDEAGLTTSETIMLIAD